MTTVIPALLTYEQYMAEGEVPGRYDILDGVRIFMAGPTWRHQRIVGNIEEQLRQYERQTGRGLAVAAPFDILITHTPLRTRQPDVLFITHQRLVQSGGIPEEGALEAPPEIVVEIVSRSETPRILEEKLADYASIGVEECWVVRPEAQTVEVLSLTQNGFISDGLYIQTEILHSALFSDLTLPVMAVFAL